jgi:hypothetical protein
MRRLLIVLSVPVLTVNLTYFLLHIDFRNISAVSVLRPVVYLLLSISATFVLLHLVTWLSAGIGLKIHSQTKAVLASVAVVTAWTVIPLVIIPLFRFRTPVQELVTTFSPYSAVAATEQYLIEPFMRTNYNQYGQVEEISRLWWACCAIVVYATLTLIIRQVVRMTCPFLLSRRENSSELPPASVTRHAQVAALEGTP